jgi:hypothetical protein
MTYNFRLSNKDLGCSKLELIRRNARIFENERSGALGIAVEVGPCSVGADAVAHVELFVQLAVCKTSTAHFDVLEQRQVAHLMLYKRSIELICNLVVVGLDATNVVRCALSKGSDQFGDRLLWTQFGNAPIS